MVVFAISFALGVWLLQQQAVLPDFAWAWLLLIFPFIIFSSLLRRDNLLACSIRLLLLAAFACGLGFYHAAWQAEQRLAVSLPDEWQGRDIEVIGVVAELPRRYERGLRFGFDVEQAITPQAGVPQHIYLSTYSDDKTAPARVESRGTLAAHIAPQAAAWRGKPARLRFRSLGAGAQHPRDGLCAQLRKTFGRAPEGR